MYCDANATARLRPEAVAAIRRVLDAAEPLNASSIHTQGRRARAELNIARRSVLSLLQAPKATLVLTSGATEACNAMVLGLLGRPEHVFRHPGHVVISAIEHPAVLEPVELLENAGWEITRVLPRADGIIDAREMVQSVRSDTALVSLMGANNESGAIQPLHEVVRALRAARFGGPIVSDVTQLAGKVPLPLGQLFADGLTAAAFSGHKLGAPAGIGGLLLAGGHDHTSCFELQPLIRGGRQEVGHRGGTENIVGCVGLGAVAESIASHIVPEAERLSELRERLWDALQRGVSAIERLTPIDAAGTTGSSPRRALPNTLFIRINGCRGDDVVVALDLEGIEVSVGSACASGKQEPSHVVRAMGLGDRASREVVRFSLDWDADAAQVDHVAAVTSRVIARMRKETAESGPAAHGSRA